MKFTGTKENLKKALLLASRAIGSNTTLPVLNNLLLQTEKGQLKISSTNLELAIKTWIGGQIDEQGEITIPAKTITEHITNITDEKITLQTQKNNLVIDSKNTHSIVKGLPAEEFPLIPDIKEGIEVSIEGKTLAEGLSQVSFASAFSETQPELSGVLFNLEGRVLKIAATDRYRLAEKTLQTKDGGGEKKVIVPNRVVTELARIMGDIKKDVKIILSENQVLFKTDDVEIISRLIEGKYPDYQEIVPKDFSTQIKIKTSELTSAFKLSGIFAQENNNVEVEVDTKKTALILNSTSQRAGSNTTEVSGEIMGGNNKIVFNYRYVLDCLNHTNEKKIILKLIDPSSPAMITVEGDDNYFYLVMPIKV